MPKQSLIVLLLSTTLGVPAAFAQEREQPEGEPPGDDNVVPAEVERAAAEAEQEVSDTWVTTKVKTALVTAEGLDNSDISVDTNRDGVVTLTGKVPSTAARELAASTAKGIEGVRKVNNMLKVVPPGKAE
jgi:hyperosmotically inducible protein